MISFRLKEKENIIDENTEYVNSPQRMNLSVLEVFLALRTTNRPTADSRENTPTDINCCLQQHIRLQYRENKWLRDSAFLSTLKWRACKSPTMHRAKLLSCEVSKHSLEWRELQLSVKRRSFDGGSKCSRDLKQGSRWEQFITKIKCWLLIGQIWVEGSGHYVSSSVKPWAGVTPFHICSC